MANAAQIRAALVRKLLEGGHRRRVEHILGKLDPRDTCALLSSLPAREARSVAALLVGPSGAAAETFDALDARVAGEALRRLDEAWAASLLRNCQPERRRAVLATLPRDVAQTLESELAGRPGARRGRWPWRRGQIETASAVVGLILLGLGALGLS